MRHFFDHPRAVTPSDHSFLYRCIELAQMARRDVYPNPYVGAVVVHNNKIIGEGFHAWSGGPHAEVYAIQSVKEKQLLKESTIYVSLEPCSHFGKTPPCSDLIIRSGIPRVVVGARDPNPRVDGGGIARLQAHGVDVHLAPDPGPFIELNKIFWLNQLQKRSYICLKWAETMDGFMAGMNDLGQAFPIRISSPFQQKIVHALRAYHHGILIGTRTAATDNPALTNRHYHGRSPIRIVLDRELSLSSDLRLFTDGQPTWVINSQKEEARGSLKYIQWDFSKALSELFKHLWQAHSLSSVLVEGGRGVLESFLREDLYDEILVFQGKRATGRGLLAPEKPAGLRWEPAYRAFAGRYGGRKLP